MLGRCANSLLLACTCWRCVGFCWSHNSCGKHANSLYQNKSCSLFGVRWYSYIDDIMAYLSIDFQVFIVAPTIYNATLSVLHGIAGTFIVANIIGNFIAIMLVDTSTQGLLLPSQVCIWFICLCLHLPKKHYAEGVLHNKTIAWIYFQNVWWWGYFQIWL